MTRRNRHRVSAPLPSLVDMVTARTLHQISSGKNTAVMLVLWDEIEEAVARGFTFKAIHTTLANSGWASLRNHGYDEEELRAFEMGYETFCKLCNSLGIKRNFIS